MVGEVEVHCAACLGDQPDLAGQVVEPAVQRVPARVGHPRGARHVEDRRGDDVGTGALKRGDDRVVVRQQVVAALEVAPEDVVAPGHEEHQVRPEGQHRLQLGGPDLGDEQVVPGDVAVREVRGRPDPAVAAGATRAAAGERVGHPVGPADIPVAGDAVAETLGHAVADNGEAAPRRARQQLVRRRGGQAVRVVGLAVDRAGGVFGGRSAVGVVSAGRAAASRRAAVRDVLGGSAAVGGVFGGSAAVRGVRGGGVAAGGVWGGRAVGRPPLPGRG